MGAIEITATARLHMGFFDLNGGLGRRYGSIGLCLDKPVTELRAWRTERGFTADGPCAERAVTIAGRIAEALALEQGMHLRIKQAIPEHAGLGAGTQITLAVGLTMSRLYGLDLQVEDIAQLTQRGMRSGIGLGTFAHGGVILDGGRSEHNGIPPVIARADFPDAWRIILMFDHMGTGVHGEAEFEAFKTLPEFSAEASAMLCRRVLMQALPALVEQDLANFGAAIRLLQEKTGDYFAPVQGGRYASVQIAAIMERLEGQNISCFGQSSWGPTGFAVFESEQQANDFLLKLRVEFPAVEFMLCKGRNTGSVVRDINDKKV